MKLVQVHRHDRQQHQCHVQQQHVPTTQQATNYEKSCIRMVNFICFYLCNLKREREKKDILTSDGVSSGASAGGNSSASSSAGGKGKTQRYIILFIFSNQLELFK